MMSGIDEFFMDSLDRAARASRPTEEIRNADYMYSSQAFRFIQANLQVEPPVYYMPSLYMKLEALARVVKDLEPPPPTPPPPPPAPPAAKGKAPPSKSTPVVPTPEAEPEPEPWKWDGSLKSISTGKVHTHLLHQINLHKLYFQNIMTVCCLKPALHLYGDWMLLLLKTRVDYKLLRSSVSSF